MNKTLLFIFLAISISLVAQTFLKKGLSASGVLKIENFHDLVNIFLKLIHNKFMVLGFVLLAVGFSVWLIVLATTDLSFIFPVVSGFLYIVLFLLSWLFLGEDINAWRIIGTIIILCGTLVVFVFGK